MVESLDSTSNYRISTHLIPFLAVIAVSSMFIFPAIYNGYPLVISDTGTYVESSFTLSVPIDRPVGYGLFIRCFSLEKSLWPVIFAQSFIIALLIYKLVSITVFRRPCLVYVLLCALLSVTTGWPWCASEILPDVFTSASILSLLFLVIQPRGSMPGKIGLAAIYIFSSSVHSSHILISLLTITAFFIVHAIFRSLGCLERKRVFSILSLIIVAWLFIPTVNLCLGAGFTFSRSSSAFIMGRLWENGVLKRFLDDQCGKMEYSLCRYRNEIHDSADYFLWDSRSPFRMSGGFGGKHEDYAKIIRKSLRLYPGMHFAESAKAALKQTVKFNMGCLINPYPEDHYVVQVMRGRFSQESAQFLRSKQQRGRLRFARFNEIQNFMVALSSALIIGGWFAPCMRSELRLRAIILFIIISVLANAIVSGTFSTVSARYQARVIWLIPLCSLLICSIYIEKMIIKRGSDRSVTSL